MKDFYSKVGNMRNCQKMYFATREKEWLLKSKVAEKEVDDLIAKNFFGADGNRNIFEYELCKSQEEVREHIRECEGKHVQQAVFSTFMDTLTQICFTCGKIRSTALWEGNRSWNYVETSKDD